MGRVFNIQKCCLKDGPGIRTTVFLKGCPLKCVWCHNPESQKLQSELSYFSDRCINCGRCVPLCPNNCHRMVDGKHILHREACTNCGLCCQTHCGNLDIFGYETTAEDVVLKVLEDRPFYETGGGITLSGGEPLFQADFCLDILRLSKENGIHTCMETCGFASEDIIAKTTEYTDLYLFDCKETNPSLHKEFTGANNNLILKNLCVIDRLGKKIILRCPIIPKYNARDDHFKGIAALAASLKNVERIELEPYHSFGEQKYSNLGKQYDVNSYTPNQNEMKEWGNKIRKYTGVPVVIN